MSPFRRRQYSAGDQTSMRLSALAASLTLCSRRRGVAFSLRTGRSSKSEGGVPLRQTSRDVSPFLSASPAFGALLEFPITYPCFAAELPASNGAAWSAETCFSRAWMPRQYFRGSIPRTTNLCRTSTAAAKYLGHASTLPTNPNLYQGASPEQLKL